MHHLVMTIIGADRPGLVESIAGIIADCGGNWLESKMSRLGAQFAGILRVEVAEEKEHALVSGLKALGSKGLSIVVHADPDGRAEVPGSVSVLEVVGHDRPGIVSQIARVLAGYGINVEDLQSELC